MSETNIAITTYGNALDVLTQQCRDLICRDTWVAVHGLVDKADHISADVGNIYDVVGDIHKEIRRALNGVCLMEDAIRHALNSIDNIKDGVSAIGKDGFHTVVTCPKQFNHADQKATLGQLAYAGGAGLDTTKLCLEGTRVDILAYIVDWINNSEPDTPRVLWLYGQAGKGKSAIAHTIANWFKSLGVLGSCFCFARDQQAERRHEKIFTTIAHDLADRDPTFKRILAEVIAGDKALSTTRDVKQQWQKFILDPISKAAVSMVGRVVIVIDALDETGVEASRSHILSVLASAQVAQLPSSYRVLIASRPLPDILEALQDVPHITSKSMDDISIASAEHDVHLYVSTQLGRKLMDRFTIEQISRLVQLADGLFEWARLACEFIKSHKGGFTAMERYEALVSVSPGAGKGLLDEMYLTILRDIIEDDLKARARFHSVMRQILWTQEPLPVKSLNAIRRNFPDNELSDVKAILDPMGALLSGIVDVSTPVRALHASFYDFLTNPARSMEFAIKMEDVHCQLAWACVQVMQTGLCFNICQLETSYLPNSKVPDLDWRVHEYIPAHLSYACQLWAIHVQEAQFGRNLAQEMELLLKDKLLFWIEALSLLKVLNISNLTKLYL